MSTLTIAPAFFDADGEVVVRTYGRKSGLGGGMESRHRLLDVFALGIGYQGRNIDIINLDHELLQDTFSYTNIDGNAQACRSHCSKRRA